MTIKTYDYMGEKYNIVEMEQVLHHLSTPVFGNNSDKKYEATCERIKMKLYTDGDFIKEEIAEPQSISGYYINEQKYDKSVDTLIQKRVYIKNASFIVRVTIAEEWLTAGKVTGWFDVIKNTEIFLNNKKDKNALKEARKTIEMFTTKANFNSIFEILFPMTTNRMEYEKINKHIYQLKKDN